MVVDHFVKNKDKENSVRGSPGPVVLQVLVISVFTLIVLVRCQVFVGEAICIHRIEGEIFVG